MKVAIAGFGIEGKVNYSYWRALGHEVTIVDEKPISAYDLPYGADSMTGPGVLKDLNGYDLVVRTASMNPSKITTDGIIWSATNEFFDKCPATIIGVTGTKGKGTTCSLITSILRAAGKTVHLVGNIGVAALDVLPDVKPDDVVVYELSSFQLWDLKKSPHIAVVLMVEPEHLNVHDSLEDYVAAKANICRFQGVDDVCIYHPTNELSRQIAYVHHEAEGFERCKDGDHAQRYGIADDHQVYVKDGYFCVGDRRICSVDALQLPGEHNIDNACAAISAVGELITPIPDDAVSEGLSSFAGLDHRLKLVGQVNTVRYYDDSIATTPGSAVAALRSFGEPKVIILGGSDKGSLYDAVVETCVQTDTHVIAIGETRKAIIKLCKKLHVEVTDMGTSSMHEIVGAAAKVAKPGGVVLLSPASASFGMFNDYADRGDQFVAAVTELSK